jgi:Na+-transporting methylmalonyl-CoA/oxaloacetate decarboxylase gamma subunit
MAVDWSRAGEVGGAGFSGVFVVLIVLAAVLWLTGWLFNRIGSGKSEPTDKKKGA